MDTTKIILSVWLQFAEMAILQVDRPAMMPIPLMEMAVAAFVRSKHTLPVLARLVFALSRLISTLLPLPSR